MANIKDTSLPLTSWLAQLNSYGDISFDDLGFLNAMTVRLYAEYFLSKDKKLSMLDALKLTRHQLNGAIDMIEETEKENN